MKLETLSWDEAEVVLAQAGAVLLPLGARLKEHGHHLPLNNDWVMAEYLAERVAAEVSVPVLPTLQHGYHPAFVDYPGSVHIGLETSAELIADIGVSFGRHGVHRMYVLNTGLSTLRSLRRAREILAPRGIRLGFSDPHALAVDVRDAVRTQPEGSHADELETSMMLYIAPELVRMERASRCVGTHRPGRLTRDASGHHSPTGVYGDATLATRDKGERLVEAMVADLVAEVRAFVEGASPT